MTITPCDTLPTGGALASFWHGALDPITYTCLASFPFQGVRLRLYAYDTGLDVPAGVELADAREIVADDRLMARFIVDGRMSLAKFSNYFRYHLLQRTDTCWLDTDFICLRKPDFLHQPVVVGYQFKADGPWALNNAVLRLPRDHAALAELSERAGLAVDHDSKWGVIGPLLITEVARRHDLIDNARPPSDFYPLQFRKFWKVLLPGYRDHLVKATEGSTFLHLWHELYNRSGYDKQAAPVPGSFLHDWCVRLDTLGRFKRVYERAELRRVLGEFITG